jgi:hypothetical protein
MNRKILGMSLILLLFPVMIVPTMAVGPKNSDGRNPNVEWFPPMTRLLLKKENDIPSLYNEWEEQEVTFPGFGDACIFMHQIYHTILVDGDEVFVKTSYSYHQQLYDEVDGSLIGGMQMEINYIGTMKWNEITETWGFWNGQLVYNWVSNLKIEYDPSPYTLKGQCIYICSIGVWDTVLQIGNPQWEPV